MVLLRMRKHSPECGDRVTARAQICLPSIALATEGLRTPWTAFAVVNEFRKNLTSIFVIRMFDIRLFKSCGLPAPSDDWGGRLIKSYRKLYFRIAGILPALFLMERWSPDRQSLSFLSAAHLPMPPKS
jgi:hypothetical protein